MIDIKEHADLIEPEMDSLARSMKQFLYENIASKLINVRIYFDGSLTLYSDVPIKRELLNKFLKKYGLYRKGHFIPNEGAFNNIYEFRYWD